MKVNLVIEPVKGDPFEKEIEVTEGDRLIFKVDAPARPDEIQGVAEQIQRFFDGASRFLVLPEGISIVKVRALPADDPEDLGPGYPECARLPVCPKSDDCDHYEPELPGAGCGRLAEEGS